MISSKLGFRNIEVRYRSAISKLVPVYYLPSITLATMVRSANSNPVVCRDAEQELLRCFITNDPSSLASNLIVQGYKAVGKTHTVLHYLDDLGIKKTVINCDECVTKKILLQRCLMGIRNDSGVDLNKYDQEFMYKGLKAARVSLLCENFAYFLMLLEQFVVETGYKEPHVLVLDRFDQCCDPTDELFASFLKLQEHSAVRNLSVVYITSHGDPREILTFSVPHILFSPYTQAEVTLILQNKHLYHLDSDHDVFFWRNFAKLVVDLYFDYTGSDLSLLLDLCEKLWPKFAEPIADGLYQPQDFLKIYRDVRADLFNDNIISNSTIREYGTWKEEEPSNSSSVADLPYHSKFILIASYLASYVDPKNDLQFFSKLKTIKKREKKSKIASLTKKDVDSRLLSAAFFDLERLKAILSVIYRNEAMSLSKDNQEFFNLYQDLSERELARKEHEFATFTLNASVDVNTQLSTLVSLGLISRTYALDILSSRIRWKCNVSWDVINDIAQEIQFPMLNYVTDK